MTATLASGCFWCTEAVFRRLCGVTRVTPGYTGGHVENPTYEQVCSGTSGHAEAVEIEFDPQQMPYDQLLEVFLHLHDPTSLNKQGNDEGTQYRSTIFYHDATQKQIAQDMIASVQQEHSFTKKPIVTTIEPVGTFYPAEDSHRDYYAKNSSQPYCRLIIEPKIQKLVDTYKPLVTCHT